MDVFYGGQIKPEHRGSLALVIRVEGTRYSGFLYESSSKEFLQLTGVQAVANPPKRVYIGVSQQCGNDVLGRISDGLLGDYKLDGLDRIVVHAQFL